MKTIYLNQLNRPLEASAATIGFFDGVHRGHLFLIKQLKELAAAKGLLTTVITFARHPRQVVSTDWQPQLLTTFNEKAALLSQTGIDQLVVLPFDREMASLSAQMFMQQILSERLNVRLLLTGYDNRFGHDRREGFSNYVDYGRMLDIDVCLGQPLTDEGTQISSSVIRRCLSQGDVEHAAYYLGHPYIISGSIVSGHQVGRQLGFPTANLLPSTSEKLLPAPGVYGVKVCVAGTAEWRPGMMNIGHRPTFDDVQLSLEAHIFNYTGNLYGQQMTVAFHHHHREERRFASVAELQEQLHKDATTIEQYLQASET